MDSYGMQTVAADNAKDAAWTRSSHPDEFQGQGPATRKAYVCPRFAMKVRRSRFRLAAKAPEAALPVTSRRRGR
jgi:hypothetical protein